MIKTIFTFIAIVGMSLFGFRVVKNPFGGTVSSYIEVSPIAQTITGYDSYNIFEDKQGGRIKAPIIHDEYITQTARLSQKNKPQPQYMGYRWIGAIDAPIISTSSVILKDNEYTFAGKDSASSTLIRIKRPLKQEEIILKTDL